MAEMVRIIIAGRLEHDSGANLPASRLNSSLVMGR